MERVTYKLLRESARLPERASDGSAGYDLRAAIDKSIMLSPGAFQVVPTGISLQMPNHLEAQVRPRSGLAAKRGVTVLNSPGTIDSDYTGEIGVILINHSTEQFEINQGDRIAQLVFASVVHPQFIEVDSHAETTRGSGGYGSSGVH